MKKNEELLYVKEETELEGSVLGNQFKKRVLRRQLFYREKNELVISLKVGRKKCEFGKREKGVKGRKRCWELHVNRKQQSDRKWKLGNMVLFYSVRKGKK